MAIDSNTISLMIKEFLVESFENLANISEEITRFEKKTDDKELLNSIYRKVHTLKGSANFLKFITLQNITHSAESLLDIIREGKIQITPEVIDVLLSSVDAVTEILRNIERTSKEGDKSYSDVLERLLAIIEKHTLPQNHQIIRDSNIQEFPLQSQEAQKAIKNDLETIKSSTEKKVTPVEVTPTKETKTIKKEENDMSKAKDEVEKDTGNNRKLADSVVRVDVNLLDKMMNIVGELVLNRNQILQYSNAHESTELHRLSQQLDIITSELQTDVMTTRMQPIAGILNKFERIVRDMGRETHKKINLVIKGKDTELDRTLLEAIKDPLTHLVRNAVDHGIELPEERKARNKPEEGLIIVKAYHEGGQVTIEIKDNGAGISRDKIIAKGIQKGLISQDQATQMTDKQVINLVFKPGFSTATKVTNISGRGVGMDVVKTNVEKIGGSVQIESFEGEGTTCKLRIPLTLAIIPALIIKGCGESFAIPQTNIVELVRLEGEKKMKTIEKVQKSEFIRLRGDLVPLLRLNNALNLNGSNQPGEKPEISAVGKAKSDNNSANIVILNAEGCVYGLIVDSILDTEEIVVKPLSKQLKELIVFAGATIMGDGSVALIIDAVGFANRIKLNQDRKMETDEILEGQSSIDQEEILLFKLSNKSLYGVPLPLVNRLEEFPKDKIEVTGEQEIIRYRNRSMPLIDLQKLLNLETTPDLEKKTTEVIPVFVVHLRNQYFGLKVNEILDIAVTDEQINSDAVDRKGIMGTVFINDRTVTLIDIYAALENLHIGTSLDSTEATNIQNKSKTILVVDDVKMFRSMNSSLLSELGYHVLTAINGEDALKVLKDQKVDLVLSDIMMPKMDGLELARTIRKDEKLSKLHVVALTSKATEKDIAEGEKAGFDCYLEKFNKHDITDTVNRFMN